MGFVDWLGDLFTNRKSGWDWLVGSSDRSIEDSLGIKKPSPPRIPALNERDAISSFRQGERDSLSSLGGIAGGPNSGFPSMADIMAKLELLGNPSRYMLGQGDLERQARAAAAQQYDPIIAQLRQAMRSSESRAGRQKDELGQMFGQLSSSLQGDIPKITEQFAQTKQNTQGEYDTLKQEIGQTYSDTQAEQEAMLKRLNLEAAAPDVFDQQFKDRDYFTNLANTEAQTQQSAIGMEERGATEYTRRGSEQARTEGTQRQANLMDQLREVLDAYEMQIGANEAAKSNAYTTALGQLSSQANEQARGYAQQDFDNYLKTIGMGRDLRNDELNQLLKGQITKVQSPADIAGRALNMGLGSGSAQQLQTVFMDAIGSDPTILSGLNSSTGTAAPKEALAARVVEKGRQMGLTQQQINALQVMALEYFGRT